MRRTKDGKSTANSKWEFYKNLLENQKDTDIKNYQYKDKYGRTNTRFYHADRPGTQKFWEYQTKPNETTISKTIFNTPKQEVIKSIILDEVKPSQLTDIRRSTAMVLRSP